MQKEVKPYNEEGSKKEQVAVMFNNISKRYDLLNHLLSLGIDHLWRKRAISIIKKDKPKVILDIATGTADFALASMEMSPDKVTGIDISTGMLDMGRIKIEKKNLSNKIELLEGDSESINFPDETFDAITVGFGVRNFENLTKGLKEIHRVLKPGKKAVILEFSKPNKFPIKTIFGLYSKYGIPLIGKAISKDNAAYTYLPESVAAFPEGINFAIILKQCGFSSVELEPMAGGIATIYVAQK
jgi:demethylmenaquinone methyltransferase/2-methoxy-6-polyprenyl-1,4-benzoquinol methylase